MSNTEDKLEFYDWLQKYHYISASWLKYQYSEREKKEFKNMYQDYLKPQYDFNEMSKEDLESMEFRPFNLNDGTLIMLIPATSYSLLTSGTEIISIHGDKLIIGTHKINEVPFAGHLSYGVIPKS